MPVGLSRGGPFSELCSLPSQRSGIPTWYASCIAGKRGVGRRRGAWGGGVGVGRRGETSIMDRRGSSNKIRCLLTPLSLSTT